MVWKVIAGRSKESVNLTAGSTRWRIILKTAAVILDGGIHEEVSIQLGGKKISNREKNSS